MPVKQHLFIYFIEAVSTFVIRIMETNQSSILKLNLYNFHKKTQTSFIEYLLYTLSLSCINKKFTKFRITSFPCLLLTPCGILAVDVAVIDARAERDFGRLEGVLRREVYVEEEDAALVDGSGWSQDGGDPLVQIVALGSGTAVGRWV